MNRRRMFRLCVHLVGVLVIPAAAEPRQPHELFAPLKPFDTGYLKVSDVHSIGYMLCGNPKGKAVFVLHGGPGAGCYPRLTQYFDPEKFMLVLHDQRGAGKSVPYGELRENTTQHLVADIEKLRKHLKIDEKIVLFGGSWGSTLALAYAESHPEQVAGMILRAVFAATQAEINHVFSEGGARLFFPQAVARLEAALPPGSGPFCHATLLKLLSSDDNTLSRKVADEWVRCGIKMGSLHTPKERVERGFGDWDPRPACRIDCHYMSNGCFLEEGQLLRDAHKLKDIPVTLINGRYDMFAPPVTAWRLHKLLPKSRLIIVEEAGHSEAEEGITRALVEAVVEFE